MLRSRLGQKKFGRARAPTWRRRIIRLAEFRLPPPFERRRWSSVSKTQYYPFTRSPAFDIDERPDGTPYCDVAALPRHRISFAANTRRVTKTIRFHRCAADRSISGRVVRTRTRIYLLPLPVQTRIAFTPLTDDPSPIGLLLRYTGSRLPATRRCAPYRTVRRSDFRQPHGRSYASRRRSKRTAWTTAAATSSLRTDYR